MLAQTELNFRLSLKMTVGKSHCEQQYFWRAIAQPFQAARSMKGFVDTVSSLAAPFWAIIALLMH